MKKKPVLTTQQRLDVIDLAITKIESDKESFMCIALALSLPYKVHDFYTSKSRAAYSEFPELRILERKYKDNKVGTDVWFFGGKEEVTKKRIMILGELKELVTLNL